MDLRKAKPSKNVVDGTGDDYREAQDWNWLLGMLALQNQNIHPREALGGLVPQDVNHVLFQKALEEFGVAPMTDFKKVTGPNDFRKPMLGPSADYLMNAFKKKR